MSTPLTDQRLAELRALADAATPGPWINQCSSSVETTAPGVLPNHGASWTKAGPYPNVCNLDDGEYIENENAEHDADFIAAARTAVPELLDEVARLRAERDAAHGCINWMAAEIVNHRIIGHKRFNATKKNPRGSITPEAEAAIEANLIAELDAAGIELRRAPDDPPTLAAQPHTGAQDTGGDTCH